MWPIQIPSLVFWFQVERSRRHPEPIGLLSMSNRKATRSWLSEANFYLSCIAGDESFLQHVETRIGWPISLLPLDLGDLIRWGPRLLQVGCGPWRCSGWGGLTFNGVKKRDWLSQWVFLPFADVGIFVDLREPVLNTRTSSPCESSVLGLHPYLGGWKANLQLGKHLCVDMLPWTAFGQQEDVCIFCSPGRASSVLGSQLELWWKGWRCSWRYISEIIRSSPRALASPAATSSVASLAIYADATKELKYFSKSEGKDGRNNHRNSNYDGRRVPEVSRKSLVLQAWLLNVWNLRALSLAQGESSEPAMVKWCADEVDWDELRH